MKSANLEMWLCFRLVAKTLKGSDAMNSALTEVSRNGTKQELFLEENSTSRQHRLQACQCFNL